MISELTTQDYVNMILKFMRKKCMLGARLSSSFTSYEVYDYCIKNSTQVDDADKVKIRKLVDKVLEIMNSSEYLSKTGLNFKIVKDVYDLNLVVGVDILDMKCTKQNTKRIINKNISLDSLTL